MCPSKVLFYRRGACYEANWNRGHGKGLWRASAPSSPPIYTSPGVGMCLPIYSNLLPTCGWRGTDGTRGPTRLDRTPHTRINCRLASLWVVRIRSRCPPENSSVQTLRIIEDFLCHYRQRWLSNLRRPLLSLNVEYQWEQFYSSLKIVSLQN